MRLVAEASTSASIRSFRSVIFRSSVRMSRMISEANRRRMRAEEPWGRMPRKMRAARGGREYPSYPAGHEAPQEESVQAALNARVRSATKSSRLSESRRSTSDSASGSTAASRSLRQAANAVTRASSSSFFRALPALRAPAHALKESLDGTSTTDSPAAANLWARYRPRPPAFSTAQRRSPNRFAQRSRSSADAVLRETSTLDELDSDFVHRRDGD